jgi:long-chain acyl-CoA synthetase
MLRNTLLDFFEDCAATRGDFLVYDDGFRPRVYSYAEVATAARGFASQLQAAGIRKGNKVLFWSENRPEWLIALWGCFLTGAIAVPIDSRASTDFLQRVGRIVEAKLLLIGDEVERGREAPFSSIPLIWSLSEINAKAALSSPPAPVSITRDDVAEIIFTSGATAEPKGVVLTHRNILANIVPVEQEVLKYKKYGRPFFPIRFLNLLPLSHMFGQAMATFVPPMLSGTVVFMRGYNPHEIARQIKKRRISVLVSVPKILDVLREHVARIEPSVREAPPKKEGVARRWWRYRAVHRLFGPKFWAFVVGAAPLDPELETFWARLGFLVVQGYGLTETAPIVTLNHPFRTGKGSVGKPIAGVEVKIAADGEILVRGENVTTGYYQAGQTGAAKDDLSKPFEANGWFHTGDIGEVDASGQLFIRGRKKEMIVTPEGLNVFPEDVERVVNALPGVNESAAVGLSQAGEERVHVALVVEPGTDPEQIVRQANAHLADHQRIRGAAVWPGTELPRTEGTKKLKRLEIRNWLQTGAPPRTQLPHASAVESAIARFTGPRGLSPGASLDELGLTSLERVELMVALEEATNASLDEAAFAKATTVADLEQLVTKSSGPSSEEAPEPVDFPSWNRRAPLRALRAVSLPAFLLPLTRVFAHIRVRGLENLRDITGPVIFASNHQSHMDTPVILAALPRAWRARVAPAMAKEFFKAHFFPEQHTRRQWLASSLNYWLAAAVFNAFPLPQREAGARQTLRYAGELLSEGFSILIFPEGSRTDRGEIKPFRPGIGMMASKLGVPVVPVRLEGLDRVLHHTWKMAKPGPVQVIFGPALRLSGDDYGQLARQVEHAVGSLRS